MRFRQLLPDSASVQASDLLADLRPGSRARADRPYTAANFAASADGHATFAGRSRKLGDDGDREIFHGLREQVDAVLAGTETLRTEGYGRIIPDAARRGRRVAAGLAAEPLACVVTRSGDVPTAIPLFAEPEARIVIFSAMAIAPIRCAAQVEVVRLEPERPALTSALGRLRRDHGVRSLLCEGGPTLFGALLAERLVDELFLTLAPKLTGGGHGPPVSSGDELAEPGSMKLRWLLERNDSLYLRYALSPPGASTVRPGAPFPHSPELEQ
jgi:riboflavin biosynthesis pyrimidine reductase